MDEIQESTFTTIYGECILKRNAPVSVDDYEDNESVEKGFNKIELYQISGVQI